MTDEQLPDAASDDAATNDEATDTAGDDTAPDDTAPDDTAPDDEATAPDDTASDDTTPNSETLDDTAPNDDPAPDDGGALVPRRLSRRRLVLALVSVALTVGYIAACGYGGDVLGNDDGLLPNGSLVAPTPSITSPVVAPVLSSGSFALYRISHEQYPGPDTVADSTMTAASGFILGGKRARWGLLTTCRAGACGVEEQQQQYADVNLHFDADVRVTARFGVLAGGAAIAPVRFEIIGDPNMAPPDGVLYDRTLVSGQSADVNVEVSGWDMELLVTGPLSEVRAGILDPVVTNVY